MDHLRDAENTLTAAVALTLNALDNLTEEDTAAKAMAVHYAEVIDNCHDQAWAMRWIAPGLLDVLEQLGATPAARSRLKGGKPADAPVSQLAKLRAAKRA